LDLPSRAIAPNDGGVKRTLALAFGLLVLCSACTSADSTSPADASAAASEASADPSYSFPCFRVPTVSGAPTFTAVYLEVLCTSGCVDAYCHGSRGAWADLDLSLFDGAYQELIAQPTGKLIPVDGRPTCSESPLLRVQPFAPEQSLLYLKLSRRAPCGSSMPPARSPYPPLDETKLAQVRRWIELGATRSDDTR
jgi:hypothetical protein